MKTIVSLYDELSQAQQAVDALTAKGVTHDQLKLVNGAPPRSRHLNQIDPERLAAELADWNVADAPFYAEQVRNGQHLVVAQTAEAQFDEVVALMNRYHPADVRDRQAAWRQGIVEAGGETRTTGGVDTAAEVESVDAHHFDAHRFDAHRADFRQHYQQYYGNTGYDYVVYEPAYRFGYELAVDSQFRNRQWAEMEAEARQRWEQEHVGGWDEFKGAIYQAWDKASDESLYESKGGGW